MKYWYWFSSKQTIHYTIFPLNFIETFFKSFSFFLLVYLKERGTKWYFCNFHFSFIHLLNWFFFSTRIWSFDLFIIWMKLSCFFFFEDFVTIDENLTIYKRKIQQSFSRKNTSMKTKFNWKFLRKFIGFN